MQAQDTLVGAAARPPPVVPHCERVAQGPARATAAAAGGLAVLLISLPPPSVTPSPPPPSVVRTTAALERDIARVVRINHRRVFPGRVALRRAALVGAHSRTHWPCAQLAAGAAKRRDSAPVAVEAAPWISMPGFQGEAEATKQGCYSGHPGQYLTDCCDGWCPGKRATQDFDRCSAFCSFLYLAFNFAFAIFTTAIPWDGCLDEVVFAFLPDNEEWDRSWLLLENRVTHPVVTPFQYPDGARIPKKDEAPAKSLKYDLYKLITAENELSQSRLSWFVAAQAFLFSPAAILATEELPFERFDRLVTFVPMIGLLSSIYARYDTMASNVYKRALERSLSWQVAKRPGNRYDTVCRVRPHLAHVLHNAVIYTAIVAWALLLFEGKATPE